MRPPGRAAAGRVGKISGGVARSSLNHRLQAPIPPGWVGSVSPVPRSRRPGGGARGCHPLRNGSARYRPIPEAGGPGGGAGIPPGCGMGGPSGFPVVSLVPRSTTGYRLPSLRDGSARYRPFPEAGGTGPGAAGLPSLRDAEWGDRPDFRWCRSFLAQPPATGFHPSGMGRRGIASSPKPEARGPGRGAAIPSGMGRRGIARSPKPEARAAGLASLRDAEWGDRPDFRWCRSFLAQPPATGFHPSGMGRRGIASSPKPEARRRGAGLPSPPGWVGAVSPVSPKPEASPVVVSASARESVQRYIASQEEYHRVKSFRGPAFLRRAHRPRSLRADAHPSTPRSGTKPLPPPPLALRGRQPRPPLMERRRAPREALRMLHHDERQFNERELDDAKPSGYRSCLSSAISLVSPKPEASPVVAGG
jgi:hypothetical protein